jgi:hypothetical protein
MTLHLDESSMMGTREMSGSEAISLRNFSIAAMESSIASSMLMSMIWAPFSTCWRATARASSKRPSRIILAKAREPVTLVRSPTFTNSDSGPTLKGSRPDRRSFFSTWGTLRGVTRLTASAIALMCAGEVPQQPPTIFTRPLRAHSTISAASCSGVSS